MKFLNPTYIHKELTLLQEIEKNHSMTQKELGNIIGAAPSMVNVYINELEERNYLKREYISTKTVNYKITQEGVKRKNYLLIVYMRELLDLYHLAKNNVGKFLVNLTNKSYKNILLYGAGEVAETIIGVIRDREFSALQVVGIVDDNKDKQGKVMLGYEIISREEKKKHQHDAIVITSYTFEDDIVDRLKEVEYPMDKMERFFVI